MEKIETILKELETNKKKYELDGVEMTIEDAQLVQSLEKDMGHNEAIDFVLNGIYDCLN